MSERTQHPKIKAHHLQREACLYVRQSTLRQVAENTESTRRQYGLSHKAMALGWSAESIRVIDDDLGKSGRSSVERSGFRDLMARIAAGEVGLVLVLEVSRLARDNADWHMLLRLTDLTETLILDEDGIYDPKDSNDRLLLGFKGTISEFELHGMAVRMLGGKLSAASRGELKTPLPIGLSYNDNDQVVLDPDRSIVDAIMLVFKVFRRKQSVSAVVRSMYQQNTLLPSRPSNGPQRGQLRWSLPKHSQLVRILRNPRYAGAYFYGRSKNQRGIDHKKRIQKLPMEQWHTLIPDHHVGFIDWDEFCRNQDIIANNALSFATSPGRNATPREGAALLQSRVLCGRCGRRMKIAYKQAHATAKKPRYYYYKCSNQLAAKGTSLCPSLMPHEHTAIIHCPSARGRPFLNHILSR